MIAIDTNILMYAFVNKADHELSRRAQRAIQDNAPVFVNDIVLTEFVWACKTFYDMNRLEIHERLEAIAAAPEFQFAQPQAIVRAIAGYGSRMSDFSDWLIGEGNLDHGCQLTLTFDKGAAKGAAFKAVSA